MDGAKTAVWNAYVNRVNAQVQRQLADFRRDAPVPGLVLSGPGPDEVAIVERAIHSAALEARQQAFRQALGPVVTAINAIDNSPAKVKKAADVRELYQCLTGVYDELHKLKSEVPPAADAVDPHADSTGTPPTRE